MQTRRSFRLAASLTGAAFALCGILAGCGGRVLIDSEGSGTDTALDGSVTATPPLPQDAGAQGQDAADSGIPGLVSVNGEIPFSEFAHDIAVLRCTYYAACRPLARFVVDTCITNLARVHGSMVFPGGDGVGFSQPSAALYADVDAGSAAYDPKQAYLCFQAMSGQACEGVDIRMSLPECQGVLSCVTGAGCSSADISLFTLPYGCSSSEDCAAIAPDQPYCFNGACRSAPCGDFAAAYCTARVAEGEPCNQDPPLFGLSSVNDLSPCAPGLTCRGFFEDGGTGICSQAVDEHGACVTGATFTGCAAGLACVNGECVVPPESGPCLAGQARDTEDGIDRSLATCKYGVAWCAPTATEPSGTCQPTESAGAPCDDELSGECGSTLVCNRSTGTCESVFCLTPDGGCP